MTPPPLKVVWTAQFKRDYRLAMKRNWDIDRLDDVIRRLANREDLQAEFGDHALSGNWLGTENCTLPRLASCLSYQGRHSGPLTYADRNSQSGSEQITDAIMRVLPARREGFHEERFSPGILREFFCPSRHRSGRAHGPAPTVYLHFYSRIVLNKNKRTSKAARPGKNFRNALLFHY